MRKPALLQMRPLMLMLWLAGCTSVPPPAAIIDPGPAPDRRAAIVHALAPACPQPLTAAALDRAGDYLDHHPDAVFVIADLDRLDRAARICRGERLLEN